MSLATCDGHGNRWRIDGSVERGHESIAFEGDQGDLCPVCKAMDRAEEQSKRADEGYDKLHNAEAKLLAAEDEVATLTRELEAKGET